MRSFFRSFFVGLGIVAIVGVALGGGGNDGNGVDILPLYDGSVQGIVLIIGPEDGGEVDVTVGGAFKGQSFHPIQVRVGVGERLELEETLYMVWDGQVRMDGESVEFSMSALWEELWDGEADDVAVVRWGKCGLGVGGTVLGDEPTSEDP